MAGYTCSGCAENFQYRFNYMVHRLHCGRYQLRYQCVECDSLVSWHHCIKRHYQRLHPNIICTHFVLVDYDTKSGEFVSVIAYQP